MITKLLLTLGVIFAAWLVLRNRQRRMTAVANAPPLLSHPSPRNLLWKWGASLLVVIMILGSGFILYAEWQERYRVVTVSVVNTQTGERVDYLAHRMDVDERHFVTLDNIEVSVADTERIEMQSAPAGRY
jgi:drug/metabolite transporter (DMT)-like permease